MVASAHADDSFVWAWGVGCIIVGVVGMGLLGFPARCCCLGVIAVGLVLLMLDVVSYCAIPHGIRRSSFSLSYVWKWGVVGIIIGAVGMVGLETAGKPRKKDEPSDTGDGAHRPPRRC